MNLSLIYNKEPELTFGFSQRAHDPRDGLTLFGPHESLDPFSVKAGVVGTQEGLLHYKSFVEKINKPIFSTKQIYGVVKSDELARPSFPGFEAVFNIRWPKNPELALFLDQNYISRILLEEKNKKRRTNLLVDFYLERIVSSTQKDDSSVNIWFIVVPRSLYFKCKPGSAGRDLSSGTRAFVQQTKAGQSYFDFPGEENYIKELEKLIDTSSDFHHLLKARLIQEKITVPVQIILDSTLQFKDKYRNQSLDENMKAHLAWTQSTTLYYKLGKLPWKLSDIRDGVCYLGLVFKKVNQVKNAGSVCSAAQMFLKDGDGSVFRGNVGAWQSKNEKEFHLDEKSSNELLAMALDDYFEKWNKFPIELFIHGRAKFSDDEWKGFEKALNERNAKTKLIGVVIKDTAQLKLFRDALGEKSNYGVIRGMAVKINEREAYLVTRGFIPRLNTAPSLEIPNSLHIQITRGEKDIETVIKDVLALTKLNYNACLYSDGLPVTLRFSDTIGNILTATDNLKTDQRQFKYYI
ncbi:MAG: hypothetical protein E6H08_08430 [Bacteroidetes bacterium]|nr:MAG: hypothetical protein E6H08_08430 [Bacteroidota bacterium]